MDFKLLQEVTENRNLEWKKHALSRMMEREISRSDVLSVILEGEVIERYPEDQPFPSLLVHKTLNERPLHVVVAFNESLEKAYIVTAYEPSSDTFKDDYKNRRDN